MSILHVKEGTGEQGSGETLAYAITTTPWEAAPTAGTIKIYDLTAGRTDVTSTICAGGASQSSNTVTFTLTAMTVGHTYRVVCPFTVGSNVWTAVREWTCPV